MDQGDRLIGDHLDAVRAALWRSLMLKNLLSWVACVMATCLIFVVVDQWIYAFGTLARSLLAGTVICGSVGWLVTRIVPLIRLRISPEYAAFSVEQDAPDLHHALTSYVTLRDDRNAPGLRGIVVRSIGVRAARHLRTAGMSMPTEALGTFRPGILTAAIFASLVLYGVLSPKNTVTSIGRLAAPFSSIKPPTRVAISDVTPGDTESLFGRPVLVSAVILGLRQSDNPAVVLSDPVKAVIPMQPNESTRQFTAEIPGSAVHQNFSYQIVAGDSNSDTFNVTVRDEPTVNLSEVQYAPHPYTQLPPRTSRFGAINGLEGTRVTVIATTNRPIKKGRIEFNPRSIDGKTSATAGFAPLDISDDGMTVSATWNLRSGKRRNGQVLIDSYRFTVWDDSDTQNMDPIEYPIQVVSDLAPEVRITVPETWPKDVPLGSQQLIEVRAIDPDFGLSKIDLRIRRGTRLLQLAELLSDTAGVRGNSLALYRFRPEKFGLMEGDRVTIEAIATDNRTTIDGSAPEPNISTSDSIELAIVSAMPNGETPADGDGLQPQDDQQESSNDASNAEQEQFQQPSEGGDGEHQQGGGGGKGDESEASEGQGSGKGASGGDGADDQSTDTNDGTGDGNSSSSSEQSGDSGSGGESTSKDGASNGAEPSGEGSESTAEPKPGDENSASSSAEQTSDAESSAGQASGTQTAGGKAGGDQDERAENQDAENRGVENQEAGNAKPDSTASPSAVDGEGTKPSDQAAQQGMTKTDRESGNKGQPASNPSADANPPANSNNKEDAQTPATSDGEAMNRILDYLDQQKQPKPQEAGSKDGKGNARAPGDAPQNPADNPSSKEPSATDDASPRENRAPKNSDPENGSQGNSEQNADPNAEPNADSKADSKNGGGSQQEATSQREGASSEGTEKGSTQPSDNPAAEGSNSADPPKPSDGDPPNGANAGQSDSQDNSAADGDKPTRDPKNPKPAPASDASDSRSPESSEAQSTNNARSNPNASQPQEQAGKPSDPAAVGNNSAAARATDLGNQTNSGSASAPDKVDVEAAKKATDLVLDSLKNQRETPDQALLDKLGWTPEQLRKFVDRWESTRKLGEQGDPAAQRQFEESLRSLGVRPPGISNPRKSNLPNDNLRDVQDSGSRMEAPLPFRDAIEAYRRSLNKN